jgi:hypothetical protein
VSEAPGVVIRRMPTYYGTLDLTARGEGRTVRMRLAGDVAPPPGGIAVRSPLDGPIAGATVNGQAVRPTAAREVVVRSLPAEVVFRH